MTEVLSASRFWEAHASTCQMVPRLFAVCHGFHCDGLLLAVWLVLANLIGLADRVWLATAVLLALDSTFGMCGPKA